MDLNTRVDHMDEEMKLLKNEIKQVLLEIQEQVLNAQNPFNVGVSVAPGAPPAAAPAARQPAPEPVVQAAPAAPMAPIIIDATTTISGGGGAPPAPSGGTMGTVFPASYQPAAPVAANDLTDAGGPSMGPAGGPPEEPPTPPASDGFGGSPFGSPLNDATPKPPVKEVVKEDEGPTSGPGADVATPPPAKAVKDLPAAAVEDLEDTPMAAGPPSPEPGLPKAEEKAKAPDKEEDDDVDFIAADGPSLQDDTDELREAVLEVADAEDEATEEPESTSETATSKEEDVPAPNQEEQQGVMNLITIAGLAQWTHRVLNKVGRENLESILEVSELTGRIPKETKEVLIALVPLFEAKESDEGEISAKEIVSLLAQLDGFLGHVSPADTRLFPFLLQDELEVFPLIQP